MKVFHTIDFEGQCEVSQVEGEKIKISGTFDNVLCDVFGQSSFVSFAIQNYEDTRVQVRSDMDFRGGIHRKTTWINHQCRGWESRTMALLPIDDWEFCVFKMSFYDVEGNVLPPKFVHFDSNDGLECGCDTVQPSRICLFTNLIDSEDEVDYEHNGKYAVTYRSFFSVDEVKRLFGENKSVDSLKVKVEIIVEINEGPGFPLSNGSVKLARSDEESDIIFKLTGSPETFRAHKEIVTAKSKVLKRMLESGMIEAQKGEILVSDEDVTKEIFDDFLNGLHGHWDYQDIQQNKNKFQLHLDRLQLSDFFECPDLMEHIVGSIVGISNQYFDTKIAADIYIAGLTFRISCLKARCVQWIQSLRKKEAGREFPISAWAKKSSDFKDFLDSLPADVDREVLLSARGYHEGILSQGDRLLELDILEVVEEDPMYLVPSSQNFEENLEESSVAFY